MRYMLPLQFIADAAIRHVFFLRYADAYIYRHTPLSVFIIFITRLFRWLPRDSYAVCCYYAIDMLIFSCLCFFIRFCRYDFFQMLTMLFFTPCHTRCCCDALLCRRRFFFSPFHYIFVLELLFIDTRRLRQLPMLPRLFFCRHAAAAIAIDIVFRCRFFHFRRHAAATPMMPVEASRRHITMSLAIITPLR